MSPNKKKATLKAAMAMLKELDAEIEGSGRENGSPQTPTASQLQV